MSLWGDASLWYKLAEANGLTAESVLAEGQPLIIPAGVQTNNNATTFKPYDPLEVLGDLSPTAAAPVMGAVTGDTHALAYLREFGVVCWMRVCHPKVYK